ncbi:MAG: hypothetical protein HQL53_04535 [Magnetococcales bacterium]|nr:hypothetical protein [Magnetococcales bacterium]
MPDLFAHFSSAYLTMPRGGDARKSALFIMGSLLPDLPARAMVIVLGRVFHVEATAALGVMHTPIGLLLLCYLLALLFEATYRRIAFVALMAGAALHLMLDLMQEPFYLGSYTPWFPFSTRTLHFDLFHYNDSVYLFPLLLILTLAKAWRERCRPT